MLRFFVLILIAVSIAGPAEARKRQVDPPSLVERVASAVAGFVRKASAAAASIPASVAETSVARPDGRRGALYDDGEIVPNPPGCPRTKFCGCGVSVKVYGHPVPALYAASSWRPFPRSACASGRVAVWGTVHVAYILTCHGDGTADLYDPNSGNGLTRIHRRDLPILIVDPPKNL